MSLSAIFPYDILRLQTRVTARAVWAHFLIDCREEHIRTGISPLLNIQVQDLQGTVETLLPVGAELDGAIRFLPEGKVAAIRNPDGHVMSLFEPAA